MSVVLKGAKEKLKDAQFKEESPEEIKFCFRAKKLEEIPPVMFELLNFIADVIDDEITAEKFINVLAFTIIGLERKVSLYDLEIPENLINRKEQIIENFHMIPRLICRVADDEFSREIYMTYMECFFNV